MDWRLKCAAFHLIRVMPFGATGHRLAQRFLTRRFFQRLTPAALAAHRFHCDNFRGGVAVEFGAGRNLLTPLLLSHSGADRVIAIDLDRIATIEQVNAMIRELAAQIPGDWPLVQDFADLEKLYRIEYRAPADARSTGLEDASVQMVCSTSTLEHIPPDEIRAIFRECRRILAPFGLMSHIIDYHDHYGTADRSITRWNFYRYTDRQWRKFNPPNHFQNRLRHSEHVRLFLEAGFEPAIERRVVQPWAEGELARTKVCERFPHDREDLVTTNGYFLLTRPPHKSRSPAPYS